MSTAIIRIASENSTTEKLTAEQQKRLFECETVIRTGQMHFAQMAKAVVTIRDEKLYLATHKTLGSYFAETWDMSPQDVTRYTNAGNILNLLEQHGFTVLPINEGQARSLFDIKTDERKLAVWDAVVKSGKKITAKLIRAEAAPSKPKSVVTVVGNEPKSETQPQLLSAPKTTEPQPESLTTCSAMLTVEMETSVLKDALEYKGIPCTEVSEGVYRFRITAKDKSSLFVELAGWSKVYAVQKVMVIFE